MHGKKELPYLHFFFLFINFKISKKLSHWALIISNPQLIPNLGGCWVIFCTKDLPINIKSERIPRCCPAIHIKYNRKNILVRGQFCPP